MRQSKGWPQVTPTAMPKRRTKIFRHTIEQKIPPDGSFEYRVVTTEVGKDGNVRTVHERMSYPLDCGCQSNSEKGIGGYCIKGLLVCPSHAKNCPINSIDPNFDWVNAPRIRPCLRDCAWRIRLLRLAHWLVTPPARSKQE
ncbi:MAG: hypothetical protein HONDAALG_03597 [Gammaproteobacteria bacterium]|nr:hypothetical protein [Gammaproteobacteria bacterium]